ncbi:hypothetical protein G647_06455 [Cladophialophora carrionii CBS 160.54]|uniref:Vacuolar ATPase assembly protein VMA22 n=1 Tax=Cladophialophora carrionii CBS 160.54 TaxID=1279043 RepID=V9D6X7_9EURO|nr:uncharacterized protein G647_06455 [Cladophialophora carrionii CBS 160.54]ETI22381.1 hypothetical protein G647_06455 [Cladophialophora carrionii CBS 160.54]
MASTLPSPPNSRDSSPDSTSKSNTAADDGESLSSRLDLLLIEYLSLLDRYTTLRARLGRDFSSGFFALAQANRYADSSLGAGRRYGEEGFDDRMKARRVVGIKRGERTDRDRSGQGVELEAAGETIQHSDKKDLSKRKNKPQLSEVMVSDAPKQDSSEPELHEQELKDGIDSELPLYTHHLSVETSLLPTKDPLRWYGILVPPALRTCQDHFATAVSSVMPELLNTTFSMGSVEDEIWTIRRELGILDEYEYNPSDIADNLDEEGMKNHSRPSPQDHEPETSVSALELTSSRSKASPAKNPSSLLSTSSGGMSPQPRSRVLKLD